MRAIAAIAGGAIAGAGLAFGFIGITAAVGRPCLRPTAAPEGVSSHQTEAQVARDADKLRNRSAPSRPGHERN